VIFRRSFVTAVFATAVVLFAAAAMASVVEERFDSGKIKSRYITNEKGVRAGAFTVYYENGRVDESGFYRDGELAGEWQKNYESGKPQERANYKAGKLDGPRSEFDEKGNLVRSSNYRDGKLNGIYQELKNGSPVVDQVFIDGKLIYPRSPDQIRKALSDIKRDTVVTTRPTETVPKHVGVNESQPDREGAVRALQAYRYLCFLPYQNLALDPMDDAHTEAATVLLQKIGHLEHTPKNPGMPDADYQFAYKGTSTSNLYSGGGGSTASVGAYMHEDGVLGHRRWCLNPPMGKTGFSYSKNYSAMWAMDGSNHQVPDYDFVAFPAPGYFPSTHFNAGDTWSVSFNPEKFDVPDKADITVIVTPARASIADARIDKTGQELMLSRFDVDHAGYGINNCVMFKPKGITTRDGSVYLVEIKGIKPRGGDAAADVQYLVEFFKP
jgi:hypothetical protein